MTDSSTEFVVVTGGSRGIGRAIVDRVQAGGRGVVNLDIRPPDAADASKTVSEEPPTIEGTATTNAASDETAKDKNVA